MYRKIKNGMKIRWVRELLFVVLLAYITGMATLLFFHTSAGMTLFTDKGFLNPLERLQNSIGINFIPFKSIYEIFVYSVSPIVVIRNILGNIFIFIPIGFLMSMLWEKWHRTKNIILFSIFVPAGIEFIQLFIGRAVDIDDVILNFIGLMIGFLLGKHLNKFVGKNQLANE